MKMTIKERNIIIGCGWNIIEIFDDRDNLTGYPSEYILEYKNDNSISISVSKGNNILNCISECVSRYDATGEVIRQFNKCVSEHRYTVSDLKLLMSDIIDNVNAIRNAYYDLENALRWSNK